MDFLQNKYYKKISQLVKVAIDKWKTPYRYEPNGISKGKIIAQIVRKYFEESNSNLLKGKSFNIKNFCENLGVKVQENVNFKINENQKKQIDFLQDGNKENIWGMLVKKESKIYVSNHLNTEQAKRFTIAHELGHLFIDSNKENQDIFFRNRSHLGSEVIVNDFAANFLVGDIEALKNDSETMPLGDLSREYKVPFETIGILLDEFTKEKDVGKKFS